MLVIHQRYGPVVRIAPNTVSFVSAAAFHDIYERGPKGSVIRRDMSLLPPMEAGPGSEKTLLFAASSAEHLRLRRLFGPAFSPSATREQESEMQAHADLLLECLETNADKSAASTQDLDEMISLYAFDFGCRQMFGKSFECLQSRQRHPILQTTKTTGWYATVVSELYRYGIWQCILPFIPKSVLAQREALYRHGYEATDERVKQGYIPGRTDIINKLIQDEKGFGWSPDEVRANGFSMAVAASDSMPTVLCTALQLLFVNPDKMATLQHELDRACSALEDFAFGMLAQLPYLNAVIAETFRMFPPDAVITGRVVETPGGQMIAGYHIPRGTTVHVSPYAAAHYAGNFARPEDFLPERWIEGTDEYQMLNIRQAVQPYSIGPRNCIAAE